MAIGKAEKAAFNDEIKDLRKEVDDIKKKVNELAVKKKRKKNVEPYYNIESVILLMRSVGANCKMSNVSLKMLGYRNTKFLDNAKSDFSRILQLMGETVGLDVDRSLKENDQYLEKIDRITPAQMLSLIQDIHHTFRNLRSAFGEDTKWKWLFVEMQAKSALITKNATSFSDIARLRDPRTEYFKERKELMELCKKSLADAAKQYRTKYELSGKARDDLQRTIELLSALRKIHVLFGEENEANRLKTTIDANRQTLEAGDKSKK